MAHVWNDAERIDLNVPSAHFGNTKIHVRKFGAGPPLLLVHGSIFSPRALPLLRAMAPQRKPLRLQTDTGTTGFMFPIATHARRVTLLLLPLLWLVASCNDDPIGPAAAAADACVDSDDFIGVPHGAPCPVDLFQGNASNGRTWSLLNRQALKLTHTDAGEYVAEFFVRLPTYCSGGVGD